MRRRRRQHDVEAQMHASAQWSKINDKKTLSREELSRFKVYLRWFLQHYAFFVATDVNAYLTKSVKKLLPNVQNEGEGGQRFF